MSLYLGNTPIAVNSSSRNIGEIIQSTIPLSDAGLHLLDGALISSAGSYAKFVTYIAGLVTDYPDLFTTEANWQSSVTTYGVCGKFVYDSVNNTVRLPKITGFTEGTTDVTALGDLVEAGLPNITGSLQNTQETNGTYAWTRNSNNATSGAIYPKSLTNESNYAEHTGAQGISQFGFDASRSSSIYGNSSTVQPQAIKVLYYIVVASSITNELNLDVADMADKDLSNLTSTGESHFAKPSDLTGKANTDYSNCSYTPMRADEEHITETYVNGTSWYRVWSDGWKEQGGIMNANNGSPATNLLKSFSNTNYTVQATMLQENSFGYVTIRSRTKTSFKMWGINFAQAGGNYTMCWYACGY